MALTPAMVLALTAVLATASFCFALAETALLSLENWQARQLARQGGRRGQRIAELLAQPQELLATFVLGNTLANGGIVALGLWGSLQAYWPLTLTVGGLLVLLLFGCEVIPKTLAVRQPDVWALRIAWPMHQAHRSSRFFQQRIQRLGSRLLHLVVPKSFQVQRTVTDAEYQELLELACQQGTLAPTEKEIILQILSLDQRTAREVMRPRSQMACLPDDLSAEEMVAAARRLQHRRLPLYDETPDTIVGVLNTRVLLLNPKVDLAEAIEFPSFVPASMNLLRLFKSLQRQQRGLAIVLDEYGGTAGLVSTEDILEAMIGKIRSEGESSGFVMERISDGCWRVNGTMRLEDFRREYPALGEVSEVETLGGLALRLKETVPAAGDSCLFQGLRLTVVSADERRVKELRIETVNKR